MPSILRSLSALRGRRCLALPVTLWLALLFAAPAARAATYNVSTVTQLDAAVANAQNGDTIQIASSTYKLDQTLQPHSGVTLVGAGASSTALDGGGSIAIIFVNPGVSVSLSRLTLQHGEGDNINGSTQGCGGGIFNNNGTVSLTDCTLTNNTGTIGFGGAAIFNLSGAVTLTRCELTNNGIQGNNVVGGGAILNAGSLTLANCDFTGNYAAGHVASDGSNVYADGGAILNAVFSDSSVASTLTAAACTFTGNITDFGGAIDNNANSQATLTGCTFTQNKASFGAGMDNVDKATATLTNCTFASNTVTIGGGGVYNLHTLTLTGCTFTGNSATNEGGGLDNEGGGVVTLTDCALASNTTAGATGGYGTGGGAVANGAGSTATLASCTLTGNSVTGSYDYGGAIFSYKGTLTLAGCTLIGNKATGQYSYGGGVENGGENNQDGGTATLANCTFAGNSAFVGGGFCNASGTATLTGCTFSGNHSTGSGGAVYTGIGSLTLTSCTITGNSASADGGGISDDAGSTVTLTDDILWADTEAITRYGPAEFSATSGGTITISYCDIQGGLPFFAKDGGNNLNTDPQFVRAPGTNGSGDPGDLHLRASSPCLNRGNNQAPAYLPTDIQGVIRPIPPTLGAYEGYEIVVTNTNPSGSGSLTSAVNSANGQSGAVITFDPSFGASGQDMPQTIYLNATLTFNSNAGATIIGPAPGVILEGGSVYQIFSIASGANIALRGLQIQHGRASGGFGGGIYNQGAVTLTDCVLAFNSAASGGAIFNRYIAILTNCVLLGNTATSGGALYNASNLTSGAGGVAALTECTLTGNSATNGGAVCNGSNSTNYLTLTDDILWNDTASNGPEIYTFSAPVDAAFCDIKGGVTGAVSDGGSNFSADPLFVTPYSQGATNFDLHVSPGSPTVGAGTSGGGVNYQSVDITGTPRANPPTVGAYEGQQLVTKTGLTSSLNPSVYGQSVTFTASVVSTATGTAPGGTVQFTANGANLGGPVTLGPNGTATVSTSTLPTGSDNIQAVYSGDGAHTGGSATLTQTVLVANMTSLASSLNPSVYGQSVTFTATVDTHGGPAPQGSVQFSANGTNIGGPVILGTNGMASISTTTLPTGTVTIGAAFTGTGFQSSTASLTQTVLVANMTSLASSLNPSVYGQSVTFTATVDTHGGPAPQGSVQFAVDGVNTGSPVPLSGTQAAYATAGLNSGSHTVTATFMGTGFQTSSASLTQTVLVHNTTGLVSSLNPSAYRQNVTFTASVDTQGGPAPQGSVQFAVDGVNTGSPVPLSGISASFATAGLSIGNHTVTATFMGTGFQTSSGSLTQTVNQATVTGVSVGWGNQAAPLTAGATLPWAGIGTLVVTLNAPAGLAPGDITLTGKSVASYGPVTVSASGSVYTVTLAKPITTPDRLTLTVGNAGVAAYSVSFSVLPGDVNGDGAVNASDMTLVKNAIGGAYKQTDDIDGSGTVDTTDYNAVRQRVGTKLP